MIGNTFYQVNKYLGFRPAIYAYNIESLFDYFLYVFSAGVNAVIFDFVEVPTAIWIDIKTACQGSPDKSTNISYRPALADSRRKEFVRSIIFGIL